MPNVNYVKKNRSKILFCGAIESRAIRHLSVFTYTRTHKCNKEITQHQFFTGEAYFKHTRLSENVRLSFQQYVIFGFKTSIMYLLT